MTKILYKKTNFKKVGFSTMAFTAKILSWRFHHLNIVGCLLKRRPTKGGGGHGHPRTPLATPLLFQAIFFEWFKESLINDVCKFLVVTILKFLDVDVIDDIARVGLGST